MTDFLINSLRGGLSDFDPPSALADDACTIAENIEFVNSTLGERRLGCTAITLPAAIIGDANINTVTWMYRHLPTNDIGDAELWVLAQSLGSETHVLLRRTKTAWSTVDTTVIDSSNGHGHRLQAVSLNGKMFLAFRLADPAIDRLYVWDGTSFRKTGLTEPAAPTAANTGSGTYAAVIRYYRVRYTVQASGVTTRRSEPSDALAWTPSGTGTGVVITKPTTITEGETHWELEASLDNANFYVLATTVVGTTTVTDTTIATAGYAGGVLSEDIGDYTPLHMPKFLSVDEGRLILGGSWHQAALASRVAWTPVSSSPGVGNDERFEEDTDPFADLDSYEGGELTNLSKAVNGYLFASKFSHLYKLVRQGVRAKAYEAIPLTKARGALPGSFVEAVDETGQPSLFWLDPHVGAMRYGAQGLQFCGYDVKTLWGTVNIDAAIPCHGVHYDTNDQVHYWVAGPSESYPTMKMIVHTNEMRESPQGARRGWVTVPSPNRIAAAHCSIMFSPNVDTTDSRVKTLVPFIGKAEWTVSAVTIKDLIQRCDTETTDAYTPGDIASAYYGRVKTKPYFFRGLQNQSGIMCGALLGKASVGQTNPINIKATRDFGLESKSVTASLQPTASETHVIAQMDDLSFRELYAVQLEMGDLNLAIVPVDSWELLQLSLKSGTGSTS